MANNNYPQITSITSEALQAQIRNLLPSQEGFGTDLMAQNVIVPIIDLTGAAEGSSVPEFLQRAMSFDSANSFSATNSTSVIANTAGFWQISWSGVAREQFACSIQMSNGLTTKDVWKIDSPVTGSGTNHTFNVDSRVYYLESGDSISAIADANTFIAGVARQIADTVGVLSNPLGFNPQ